MPEAGWKWWRTFFLFSNAILDDLRPHLIIIFVQNLELNIPQLSANASDTHASLRPAADVCQERLLSDHINHRVLLLSIPRPPPLPSSLPNPLFIPLYTMAQPVASVSPCVSCVSSHRLFHSSAQSTTSPDSPWIRTRNSASFPTAVPSVLSKLYRYVWPSFTVLGPFLTKSIERYSDPHVPSRPARRQ